MRRLCKHQLEHEGGAFWCNLPLGHPGPHEPMRDETEKRQRAPPKRLTDETEDEERKKRSRPMAGPCSSAVESQQSPLRKTHDASREATRPNQSHASATASAAAALPPLPPPLPSPPRQAFVVRPVATDSSDHFPIWVVRGAYVEVKMEEDGLHGSRYLGRIIDVSGSRAFVEFQAFLADDAAAVNEGSEQALLTDWVGISQLAPPPPPPPPDFFDKIEIGAPVELYHEEGWWEVTLQRTRPAPSGNTSYHVVSAMYGTERWVNPDRLRPRWHFVRELRFQQGEHRLFEFWRAEAPVGLEVWEEKQGERSGQDDGRATAVINVGDPLHQCEAGLRAQLSMLQQLACGYHAQAREMSAAAMRMFPLARTAVERAGGSLTLPACFTRDIRPPVPASSDDDAS